MTVATDHLGTAPGEPLPEPPLDGPGFFPAPDDAPGTHEPDPAAVASTTTSTAGNATAIPYRVLARTWRPRTFDDLIGQDATVRVLRRAFATGRVAHAYLLTGTRGVGKTTTARIIARALCCIGPDGQGGATADPCPDPATACANCRAIEADRHPDVLELDAASRTGVDDVREIIEATRFRPMQARGKVFIVDEVHMLSRNAFNALLKTLEEPPPHVTFVFATTELRKVPVTVLSRCQRFDLRRVPEALLAAHFGRIAAAEGATVAPDALRLLARAADGSVRDGLSLLDQSIATAAAEIAAADADGAVTRDGPGVAIGADAVAAMLGLADRGLVFDLAERVFAGDPAGALAIAGALADNGADPATVLGDLLELVHLLGRLKAVPSLAAADALPELERTRGGALAGGLGMATVGRAWQLLLKGFGEIEGAPDRQAAADMVLLRLCHLADVPGPGELIRRLDGGTAAMPSTTPGPVGGGSPPGVPVGSGPVGSGPAGAPRAADVPVRVGGPGSPAVSVAPGGSSARVVRALGADGPVAEAVPTPDVIPDAVRRPWPRTWTEVVALLAAEARDPMLVAQLREWARPVRVAPPVIELSPLRGAPRDLAARLATRLAVVLGARWTVVLSGEPGDPTLAERRVARRTAALEAAREDPLVMAMQRLWPDAELALVEDDGDPDAEEDADGSLPLAGTASATDPDAPDQSAPFEADGADDPDDVEPPSGLAPA